MSCQAQGNRRALNHVKILFNLNEAPYGSEKSYNGLRLAMALQKDQPGTEVLVFLMADAVTAALPVQSTPQGYYNIERTVKSVVSKGGQVRLCGACCEARGIKPIPLLEGVEISTMNQLAQWTVESERVLVFWCAGTTLSSRRPCSIERLVMACSVENPVSAVKAVRSL